MSSGLDGSGGAQGDYLAVPVPNSAPYIGHASNAPVPGVYSTCSSLGGLKFKRNNAEQVPATTSVVEATSMAQLHGVSRSNHDGIGTNESSVLDSDGVTISRESGENTSTTLVSRAQSWTVSNMINCYLKMNSESAIRLAVNCALLNGFQNIYEKFTNIF